MGDLTPLLRPRSIALLGASSDPGRGNGRTLRYLIEGGFAGPVYPVNNRRDEVQGLRAYRSILDVPEPVDIAIVAVPAAATVDAIRDCARRQVKSAVIFAAGFAELGAEGRAMQDRISAIARQTGIRVLGPNSLGLYDARVRSFMTFSSMFEDGYPDGGRIGMVTQSGGYGSQVRKLAWLRGLSIVQWVSTGNECDVDAAELIDAMALDPGIDVILCYLEGARDGLRLVTALENARLRRKPVIAIKVGRTGAGSAAAASHTAALAGEDRIFDEVFRRHGVYRADSVEEMLDVAYAATRGRLPAGDSVVILSPSGGFAVHMTDQAIQAGLRLPRVPDAIQDQLRAMIPFSSPANPVDITGQVLNDLGIFGKALDLLLSSGVYDAAALFVGMAGAAPSLAPQWAAALTEATRRHPDKTMMLSILAGPEVTARYEQAGFTVFEDTSRMLRAHGALVGFSAAFRRPSPPAVDAGEGVRPPPDARDCRTEADAKRLLGEIGIPVPAEAVCSGADEAVRHASAIGFPVAVKVVSKDIAHKTEVGGVHLDLADADAVRVAVDAIERSVRAARPDADIDGYLLTRMYGAGVDCLLGIRRDPVFGPVIVFGAGGVLAELVEDTVVRLAPVSEDEALDMIGRTRVGRLLQGFRNAPPGDLDALKRAISRLSRFAAADPGTAPGIEVNPLRVFPAGEGVVALDALVSAV
ncbi:MAG: acetate--CoA ligase family protein [Burkholderiaceae bacterium]|nr:acetate--CoA ligase family protein [Burkholderiaceae bacterium]MEB2351216.1 acetate--CoA ligase family protein [Burkholderiaceae bacterium]